MGQSLTVRKLSNVFVSEGVKSFQNPAQALAFMLKLVKENSDSKFAKDFSKLSLANHRLLLEHFTNQWAQEQQVTELTQLSSAQRHFQELLDDTLAHVLHELSPDYRSCLTLFDGLIQTTLTGSALLARGYLTKESSTDFALWYLNHLAGFSLVDAADEGGV